MISRATIEARFRRLRQIVSAIRRAHGNRLYRDLDHLAGTWTADQADAFDRRLAEQRQVDEAAWTLCAS